MNAKSMTPTIASALKLIEDIKEYGGLRRGGEQYPNSLNVIEQAGALKLHIEREWRSLTPDTCSSCDKLATIMIRVWKEELDDSSTILIEMIAAAEVVKALLPPIWNPKLSKGTRT